MAKRILVECFGRWLGIVGLLGELGFSQQKRVVGVGESLVMFLKTGIFELSQGVEEIGLDVEIGFGEESILEKVGGRGML